MGYLQIFGAKLEELMRTRGLTEAQREEILAYVKEYVLQSYKNGLEQGRKEMSAPPSDKPAPRQNARRAWRPARKTR